MRSRTCLRVVKMYPFELIKSRYGPRQSTYANGRTTTTAVVRPSTARLPAPSSVARVPAVAVVRARARRRATPAVGAARARGRPARGAARGRRIVVVVVRGAPTPAATPRPRSFVRGSPFGWRARRRRRQPDRRRAPAPWSSCRGVCCGARDGSTVLVVRAVVLRRWRAGARRDGNRTPDGTAMAGATVPQRGPPESVRSGVSSRPGRRDAWDGRLGALLSFPSFLFFFLCAFSSSP